MENKLVFKPTTLTQYNWKKYVLNENRTYYWDKYEAEPEYTYTYFWNKYEAVPPGPTNQWDVYEAKSTFQPEYDSSLVLQVWYEEYYWGWTLNHKERRYYLRVLRNSNTLNDTGRINFNHFGYGPPDNANWVDINIGKQVQGAYLFLTPKSDKEGYLYNNAYRNHIYLAKSLKDITQKTNLIECSDIILKNSTLNDNTREQRSETLQNYIKQGYIYCFTTKKQYYPLGVYDTYNQRQPTYEAYENGIIFGHSVKIAHDLIVDSGLAYSDYPANNFIYSNIGNYRYANIDYSNLNCQYNDYDLTYLSGNNNAAFVIQNISPIQVLNPDCFIVYNANGETISGGFFATLQMAHNLNYDYYSPDNPRGDGSGVPIPPRTGSSPVDGDTSLMIYPTNQYVQDYFNTTTPSIGQFRNSLYNDDINAYPQSGIYNNNWYFYIGETILDNYSPGELIEENINSHNNGDYPYDGLQNGYYYIYQYTNTELTDWIRTTYIGRETATTFKYPKNGAYPVNYQATPHYWYSFIKYTSVYTRGNYIEPIHSFIESAYPQNSYIVNDAWYVSTGSEEVIVGELVIDETKLMGGVNYTQEINPSEDLMIGAGGAAQVDFTIFAPDANAATQYLGKDFVYFVRMSSEQNWRQMGIFTLTTAELPDKQTAKIEGFDYIYKFDVNVDDWLDGLTFPMSLGQLFNSLCEYVGCEAYSTEFNNSNFVVNDNFEAVQITGRTILQYITEVSGGFCVAEPDGRIHIKQYSIPPTGTINLGNDSYVKYTHEIYNVPVITSVVVRKDDEDEGVESNV